MRPSTPREAGASSDAESLGSATTHRKGRPPLNKHHPVLVSSLLLVGVGLVAFFPILFLGRCYDANDLLFQFAPWRQFLRDSLAQGFLPFWNPHNFAGQPFFADIQSQMLYLPNYLTLLPSVPVGMGWYTFLHFLIAAFGARHWLRSLELSEMAARVGALVFSLSGFFFWEIIHPPVLAAFAWLPWFFSALEHVSKRPSARVGWYLGAAYAMLFLAGSFQVTLGATYAGLFYLAYRLWKGDRKEGQAIPHHKAWGWALLAAALGASLLLPQLHATAEFTGRSVRENAGKDYAHFNAYWSLQPSTLGQFLLPRLGLTPGKSLEDAIQEVTGDGGRQASNENIGNDYLANFGYLGVWLPLMVFLAFRERRRHLALLLSILSVLALALCFGKYFFLHALLCQFAPGFSLLRAPFRFLYLYVLPMSALVALGFQALTRENRTPEEARFHRTLVLSYGAIALLFCLAAPSACWREALALLLMGVGVFLLGDIGRSKWGRLLIGIALVGPLLLSGFATYETRPASNLSLEKNAPWLEYARARSNGERLWLDGQLPYQIKLGDGREVSMPSPVNAACVWGLKVPSGYNPLQLREFSEAQSTPFPVFSKLVALPRLLMSRKMQLDPPAFKLVSETPLALYESVEARPRVFAPARWLIETSGEQRLARLRDPAFNPYLTSILDQAPPDGLVFPAFDQAPALSSKLVSEKPNHQSWEMEASAPLLAVFSDAYYPGWAATVDGRPATLLKANHGFRALPLGAGAHQVELTFKPLAAKLFWPVVFLWLLAGILVGFLLRRPSPASKPA